jgi:hypothetical protein
VWLEIEKKKVRNCRQYKEGRGQQGVMGERGRRNSKPKSSINIHQPNIVEITHLCIMHGVHTSKYYSRDVHFGSSE